MIKDILITGMVVSIFFFSSCVEKKDRYVDLTTGKPVRVIKDEKTGYMINADTKEGLYMYVDTKNNDTIYAKNGEVVNNHIIKTADNKYVYEEDEKLKVESGQVKYKQDNYKVEVEKDGDVKIKNGTDKVKIDGKTGERKKKKDD